MNIDNTNQEDLNIYPHFSPTPPSSDAIQMIPITQIHPDPNQPRQFFSSQGLEELAQSIAKHGILNPLLVHLIQPNHYQIIAGERRWRAAQLLQLATLPCVVRSIPLNSTEVHELALIENIQRENLSPIEEARTLKILSATYTHEEIAERIGKKRSTVTNLIRILDLPLFLQDALEKQQLQLGHLKLLYTYPESEQIAWARLAIQKNWSVRELENRLKREKTPQKTQTKSLSQSTCPIERQQIIEELKGMYGTQVNIQGDSSGTIEFRFYNPEDLKRLVHKLMREGFF